MTELNYDFRFPSQPRTSAGMSSWQDDLAFRLPPSSFNHNDWHNLNLELAQNVKRELADIAEDEPVDFEEQWTPRAAPTRLQDEYDWTVNAKDDKVGFTLEESAPTRSPYMGRESPFALDFQRSDMSFIEYYPKGNATITFPDDLGHEDSITGLHPWVMEERCPLIAHAFEESRSGARLHLDILTPRTAKPFLQYLYTGSYAVPGPYGDTHEDVPTSILLHCQMYRLAEVYDLVDLKQQAQLNVIRQCEFGCSSPDKPIELCAAIEFVYKHLKGYTALIENIICYCVTCFLRHRLQDEPAFQALTYRLRAFTQDLCRESMKRNFEDEACLAIIRMPSEPHFPETYVTSEDIDPARLRDVVYDFHGDDAVQLPKKRKRPGKLQSLSDDIAAASREGYEREHSDVPDSPLLPSDEPFRKRSTSCASTSSIAPASLSSESEYEIIPGPAPVEELSSESESEPDALAEDIAAWLRDDSREPTEPISDSTTLVEPHEAEDADLSSDSEWSVV